MTKNEIITEISCKTDILNVLFKLGVSIEGISALLPDSLNIDDVQKDLNLILDHYQKLPPVIADIVPSFSTWLWTLFAEISVPESLGTYSKGIWPVLVFPFANKFINNICDFIILNDGQVTKTENISICPLLHACIYAGQPWYPSLENVYNAELGSGIKEATLIWFVMVPGSKCTAPSLARKLQIHLRPNLPAHEVAVSGKLYPGIFRAFHTPHLGNIDVHRTVLEMECWR